MKSLWKDMPLLLKVFVVFMAVMGVIVFTDQAKSDRYLNQESEYSDCMSRQIANGFSYENSSAICESKYP